MTHRIWQKVCFRSCNPLRSDLLCLLLRIIPPSDKNFRSYLVIFLCSHFIAKQSLTYRAATCLSSPKGLISDPISRHHSTKGNHSVFTSPQSTFIVDGQRIYMHGEMASFHSKVLDRMMNGHMSEAHTKSAPLSDVDKDTFIRFVQWAYTKSYTPATHILVPASKSLTEADKNEDPGLDRPENPVPSGGRDCSQKRIRFPKR